MLAICCNAYQVLSAMAISRVNKNPINYLIVSNNKVSRSAALTFQKLFVGNHKAELLYVICLKIFHRVPLFYYLWVLAICRCFGFIGSDVIIRSKIGVIERCWINAISPTTIWLVEDGFGDLVTPDVIKKNLRQSVTRKGFDRWLWKKSADILERCHVINSGSVFGLKNVRTLDQGYIDESVDISNALKVQIEDIAKTTNAFDCISSDSILILPSFYGRNPSKLSECSDELDLALVDWALHWIDTTLAENSIVILLHPRAPAELYYRYKNKYPNSKVLYRGSHNADVLIATGLIKAVVATYHASTLLVASKLFKVPAYCFRAEELLPDLVLNDTDARCSRVMEDFGIVFVGK